LLYVAMTRARDELHLMVPQRFFVHPADPAMAIKPSVRPAHALHHASAMVPLFDDMFWPAVKPAEIRGGTTAPKVDIGANLRQMWKKA
jgi:DNA helicase-2/ATP-dependent DNA helicase PcrA